jgi:hypothetical protein
VSEAEELGYIEAYQIIEEAHGAEEILLHARDYVDDQIPRYLRGTY